MKLSDFKKKLNTLDAINFIQANGEPVPSHFHITEVGSTSKHFIDCGGTIREESVVNFQLWEANDTDHQLSPQKLLTIIDLSKKKLGIKDMEIEVEYQTGTIGRYGVDFNGNDFILINKQTNCLASDKCGISEKKLNVNLSELGASKSCCTPGTGCC